MRTPRYWLAELDQYDNPTLIDGPHETKEGPRQAAFLIEAMALGKPNRRFAIAEVNLSECTPISDGVNMDAVRTINTARRKTSRARKGRAQ